MKIKKVFIFIFAIMLCSCGELSDSIEGSNISLNEQTLEQLQLTTNPTIISEKKSTEYIPINFTQQKSIWFTMMDYENILNGKTETEFTDSITNLLEKIKNTGFNTVYVHIRPYNDSYYKSEIFPASANCSDDFDSFEIILEKAHELNLSVHGWINPLRCQKDSEIKSLDDKYFIKKWYDDEEKNGSYICKVDDRWYLNPAYEEVRDYITDGVKEIIENYDVDGIHIDDYFYPTQDESFDKEAFENSAESDLQQWRIGNINIMVKGIYDTVKAFNPELLFGISPQGNMNIDYSTLYADVKKWCSEEGYCDYIVPQIYYGFKNENLPFEETVEQWKSENTCEDVYLVIGICTYKIGKEDKWAGSGKDEWINDKNIPSRQAEFVFENSCSTAIYSVETLFNEENSDELNLLSEIFKNQEDL